MTRAPFERTWRTGVREASVGGVDRVTLQAFRRKMIDRAGQTPRAGDIMISQATIPRQAGRMSDLWRRSNRAQRQTTPRDVLRKILSYQRFYDRPWMAYPLL